MPRQLSVTAKIPLLLVFAAFVAAMLLFSAAPAMAAPADDKDISTHQDQPKQHDVPTKQAETPSDGDLDGKIDGQRPTREPRDPADDPKPDAPDDDCRAPDLHLSKALCVQPEVPRDDAADKPAEEPAEKPAEKPAEEPADEPEDEPVEEPEDEPVEETADEPAEETAPDTRGNIPTPTRIDAGAGSAEDRGLQWTAVSMGAFGLAVALAVAGLFLRRGQVRR